MLWTIHDVRDELETAIELLKSGDLAHDTPEAATAFHVRARNTIERAYRMAAEGAATLDAMLAGPPSPPDTTEPSSPSHASGEAPHVAVSSAATALAQDAEVVSALPRAFLAPDVRLVRALSGPFKDQSLAMYPNRTRWIVRDAGGVRVSVFTDSTVAPADAFPGELAADVKVEGFYQAGAQDYAALWTPIVALADRVGGLPT